ncbi:hypothetical protein [Companilactobacillus mishanensis]|uniref:DUF3169 family protein n=1 Tax=Companilactobacillus mishanensis TaxID=2486008 RepID=A0ABW9P3Q9_9LACO|nr:hypothetical protein [Companilactobacillus mishanensis]MQS43908.1 hypothetical protein [Companilactobacillus mishanensis]
MMLFRNFIFEYENERLMYDSKNNSFSLYKKPEKLSLMAALVIVVCGALSSSPLLLSSFSKEIESASTRMEPLINRADIVTNLIIAVGMTIISTILMQLYMERTLERAGKIRDITDKAELHKILVAMEKEYGIDYDLKKNHNPFVHVKREAYIVFPIAYIVLIWALVLFLKSEVFIQVLIMLPFYFIVWILVVWANINLLYKMKVLKINGMY